jgi:hypothetical protein
MTRRAEAVKTCDNLSSQAGNPRTASVCSVIGWKPTNAFATAEDVQLERGRICEASPGCRSEWYKPHHEPGLAPDPRSIEEEHGLLLTASQLPCRWHAGRSDN